MAKQPTYRPVRLSDVIGSPWWIWAFCLDCQHDRFIRPEEIALPGSFPICRIGERMICSSCRGRRIHTKTSQCWYDLDPGQMLPPSFREDVRKERRLVGGMVEPRGQFAPGPYGNATFRSLVNQSP